MYTFLQHRRNRPFGCVNVFGVKFSYNAFEKFSGEEQIQT